MSKKQCELCSNPARMFCDSDQASLCWDCDEKVHAANFLVAKHSRTLLCHHCCSPTPWNATGPRLAPTVSLCQSCTEQREGNRGTASSSILQRRGQVEDLREDDCDSQEISTGSDDEYSESEDYSDEEEEEEEEDEDGGENQVVPWSASSSTPPESPLSCSTEEDASFSSLKRICRENNPNFESEDEDGYCSSPNLELDGHYLSGSHEDYGSSSMSMFRPLKKMRKMRNDVELPLAGDHAPAESSSGTAAIIDNLQRFQQQIFR